MRWRILGLCCLIAAALVSAARPGSAASLRFDDAKIEFDPNGNIWHLAYKICARKSGGDSGSLKYEIRLIPVSGGTTYNVGSRKFSKPIPAGYCVHSSDLKVGVRTERVPQGRYRTAMWIGEWTGSAYSRRGEVKFDRDFIKN